MLRLSHNAAVSSDATYRQRKQRNTIQTTLFVHATIPNRPDLDPEFHILAHHRRVTMSMPVMLGMLLLNKRTVLEKHTSVVCLSICEGYQRTYLEPKVQTQGNRQPYRHHQRPGKRVEIFAAPLAN